MSTIEKRIERLETQAERAAESNYVTWILMCRSDEEGPTDEDMDRFERAYIARYGKPKSPVMVNAVGGMMSASKDGEGLEVHYECRAYLGDSPKPFREITPLARP